MQTERDAQERFWEEYKEYIEDTPMSACERRRLWAWVRSGHSVYETVESKYLPGPAYPPMDFLDAYRLDRKLSEAMKGMNAEEKETYLKAFMGYEDPLPEELAMEEAKKNTPKIIEERIRRLERELFALWNFVWQEGLGEEAREFVNDHKDEEMPFEW